MSFCCFAAPKGFQEREIAPSSRSVEGFCLSVGTLFALIIQSPLAFLLPPEETLFLWVVVSRGGVVVLRSEGTLRDGTEVAIKSLSTESSQGTREFLNEINVISNVRHPNLVQLIGCCIDGKNRMLVYEYLENNSLATALLGQLTKKADVYSFGVVLLEVVSGRSSSSSAWGMDMMLLVEWTWKLQEEGRLLNIADPELVDYPDDEVLRFIKVALLCTQAVSNRRPSMNEVIEMLSNEKTSYVDQLLSDSGVYKSSPQVHRGKNSMIPFGDSTRLSVTLTQMQPR
ncbi:hypothetical protein Sjap_001002 [Stephania japonica]|uniref:Protein kinase domain-containing protein n=1 Tax=Stephania japonica TaxID=461633 RepID=A0AAP0KJ56_9MAGN